jgi:PAS domain S-box-containing protein
MNVPFRKRLSVIQARNTLLIVGLLALATSGYQIFSDLYRYNRETATTINQVMYMQEESAALAAWSLDTAGAERVIKGLFHYLPIYEARLETDAGVTLAEKEREQSPDGTSNWLAEQIIENTAFSIQLFISGVEHSIGKLSFKVDRNIIAAGFLQRTTSNILATAVPLIGLSIFLVLMFYYLLTKPLFHLSARLAAIDVEKPVQALLQIPTGHQHDELGLVVETINRLLSKFELALLQRRLAEKDLQEAEKKYRSIFDNAVEGIFQTSLEGRFLSANPYLAKVIGYDSPEHLMREVTDIGRQLYVDAGQRDEVVRVLMLEGFIVGYETQFYRRDGTILWGNQNARIVRDETGSPLFIEGTVADISESKKAMADLARVEAQLMQSQKMEALGNLAGGVAHDFNNLLQIISGLVQLLLIKKKPTDPDYRYLSEVHKAAGRAADLIRRMLTFSRKVEAQKVPLNLNEVILEAVHLLERTVPKMICIRTLLAPDLAIIPADPTQIEQVIMNLANNAVHAMSDTGTLTIETENFPVVTKYVNTYLELLPGDYVLMKVTDTGHGMDEPTRQRIFEPFFTTKGKGQGTGLGLSSVYGIVTGHAGKITCYSEPGTGTTFKIFLPVAAAGEWTLQSPADKSIVQAAGGNETILLVDDEEALLDIAGDILHQYGYATCTAGSGEEAIAAYRRQQAEIDLIIMDLGMPGMGGQKCLEILREIDPQVKVIIASGYGSYEITKNPREFGAAAFINKPYHLDIMLRTVREVLDGD